MPQLAAGHGEPNTRTGKQKNRDALRRREVEVLRLAAGGLTTNDIASLYISPKTADHHIHRKIGVSTRAAASFWANAAHRPYLRMTTRVPRTG